jgi:hypothetical protein
MERGADDAPLAKHLGKMRRPMGCGLIVEVYDATGRLLWAKRRCAAVLSPTQVGTCVQKTVCTPYYAAHSHRDDGHKQTSSGENICLSFVRARQKEIRRNNPWRKDLHVEGEMKRSRRRDDHVESGVSICEMTMILKIPLRYLSIHTGDASFPYQSQAIRRKTEETGYVWLMENSIRPDA